MHLIDIFENRFSISQMHLYLEIDYSFAFTSKIKNC